jgi:hypothetical protein
MSLFFNVIPEHILVQPQYREVEVAIREWLSVQIRAKMDKFINVRVDYVEN